MRKTISTVGLALASSAVLCGAVLAHGGTYRGPGDTVPPSGAGGGGGGGGPAGGPGPVGPVGPANQTPGPAGGSTGDPGNTGRPVTQGPNRSVTGGAYELGPDFSLWSFWWEFNKEPYLNLKDALFRGAPNTGTPDFWLGGGEREAPRDLYRPDPRVVDAEVVPALLHALETESNNDIVTGALVALAKIGDVKSEGGESRFHDMIAGFLDDGEQEIAETAALALGILAHDDSAPLLSGLLLDGRVGHAAMGKSSVPERTRAFAAYGLGLIGKVSADEDLRRRIVGTLVQAYEGKSATRDVGVGCIIALGLIPLPETAVPGEDGGPTSGLAEQVRWLMQVYEDEDAELLARAHAPRSAAQLVERESEAVRTAFAERLLAVLERRVRPEEVLRQSAVLALGRIGDCDEGGVDQRIREVLVGLTKKAPDRQTSAFARIALGQVGSRDGRGDPSKGREQARKPLLSSLGRGVQADRQWSALGLAVMGHELAERGHAPTDVQRAVREALEEATSPHDVSSLAIAAGLLRDVDAKEILREKLERSSVDEVRGYVAVGLGLLGQPGVLEEISDIVVESEYRPELLRQAAIALGLLGDKEIVPVLVRMLGEARSLASQASIASALGFIGDRRSITPLVEMLGDRSKTSTARGFAAVALGAVADLDAQPWTVPISVDLNYRAAPETLNANSMGTGVLNIL